jgi:hypothetical protein
VQALVVHADETPWHTLKKKRQMQWLWWAMARSGRERPSFDY